MVEQFIKFIKKSPHKQLFEKILDDILHNHLDGYDIQPLVGHSNLYRLKAGSVRFIFKKSPEGNKLIRVNNRGDIYKNI